MKISTQYGHWVTLSRCTECGDIRTHPGPYFSPPSHCCPGCGALKSRGTVVGRRVTEIHSQFLMKTRTGHWEIKERVI